MAAGAETETRRATTRWLAWRGTVPARQARIGAEAAAVGAVLLLSAGLNLSLLDRQGFGNTYYAAAVKSMLSGWSAFWFAAFDSGGFVTVDKPPVGLWVQALSARLFGFTGPSLFLPQALAGVLSVALLYWLVRRAYGAVAGIVAAAALAVTPITVVVDRNNTMDAQLVLVLLLAAWAAGLAVEAGRWRWLLASAALVGIGYNVKMLQAYPVLAGCWLPYLLWAPVRWPRRLLQLVVATLVLLAVSLSWSLAVDLTPPDQRPFIGSSGSNSALSLALGYNGLGRFGDGQATQIDVPTLPGVTIDLASAPGFAPGIGEPGPSRLLRAGIAEQASWLLPLALVGLVAALVLEWDWRRGRTASGVAGDTGAAVRRRTALAIWGGWLLAWAGYFSAARFYHLYYLCMLAPAVAALAGIGAVSLWRLVSRWRWGVVAPVVALLTTAALQLDIVGGSRAAPSWLGAALLASSAVAASALLARALVPLLPPALGRFGLGLGVVALLLAPGSWSADAVRAGNGGAWLPQAGTGSRFGPAPGAGGGFTAPFGPGAPGGAQFQARGSGGPPGSGPLGGTAPRVPGVGGSTPASGQPPAPFGGPAGSGSFRGPGGGPGGGALTFAGESWDSLDPTLVRYLVANRGSARYLVATPTSSLASLFMLASAAPALALGGYQGWDRILTPERFQRYVTDGAVRFFLLGEAAAGRFGGQPDVNADLEAWVRANCAPVPTEAWRGEGGSASGAAGAGFGQQLYDCAGAG